MPSPSKPKKFVAVREITVNGRRYQVGDPVTDQRALGQLLRYGDQFVTVKRSQSASAETPTAESEED